MEQKPALTEGEIRQAFVNARNRAIYIKSKFGIDCCTDAILVKNDMNDAESKVPIQVWYNKEFSSVCFCFSNLYLQNSIAKVMTAFTKSFLIINPDGSFKKIPEFIQELRPVIDFYKENKDDDFPLLEAFMSNFLDCSEEVHYNAVCIKCHAKHEIELDKIDMFSCTCGGALIPKSSSDFKKAKETTDDDHKKRKYTRGETIDVNIYSKEYFSTLNISDEVFDKFTSIISNCSNMNCRLFKNIIMEAIDKKEFNLAKMFKMAFPDIFDKSKRAIGNKRINMMEGKIPSSICREDYDCCNDEEFAILETYINSGASVNKMKKLLHDAIKANKISLVRNLLKADRETFIECAPLIGKKNYAKLRNIGGIANELDVNQNLSV